MSGVEIIGLGHYVPERRVPNSEIEARLGLDAGWIKKRTGIEARRYAAVGEALSDMAVKAGEVALEKGRVARSDVALVLLATSTPDHLLPPSAPLVAHRLGLDRAGGIDLAGACGGFIYAITLADAFVRLHKAPVLVIAANVLSRRINLTDRASSVLFADAAGAALLVPSSRRGSGINGAQLASHGAHYDLIKIPGGGSRKPFAELSDVSETVMVLSNGQAVYAHAVDMMATSSERALNEAGVTAGEVHHFIPHQANMRMMKTLARRLHIDDARLLTSVADYGNSSAATIPLTLSLHAENRRYQAGDVLLLSAAGAGMTGGAVVWRW
jgi:3-oxoacyl-[acyl-carrier-protein] synthase III